MEVKTVITLSHDDILRMLPFGLICATRNSAVWNTGRCQRAFAAAFTESERETCEILFKQSKRWYVEHGVPEATSMPGATFALWFKLGDFCADMHGGATL